MVLESTMICVDNSDYMRNGDFVPTRLLAQQDAVNLVCHSKTRSNPENNVGLVTFAKRVEVMTTLTSDVGKILAKLQQVKPDGEIKFTTGLRIAHLALKHRQGKNHKMRIVAFVGSPISCDEKELITLAKRLKKEKVNVDIVSFGEDEHNEQLLTTFINTLNGKDGTSSHLVTIPPGPHLSDALLTSAVIQGEDRSGAGAMGGSGFEFGVDPNEDPELALALRVSIEEQRQRQQQSSSTTAAESDAAHNTTTETPSAISTEEALLERALAMSVEETASTSGAQPSRSNVDPNFDTMTEEEQIEFAMRMSMQDMVTTQQSPKEQKKANSEEEPMEVEYSAPATDTAYLRSVLESLPGVDSMNASTSKEGNATAGSSTAAESSSKKDSETSEDRKQNDKS